MGLYDADYGSADDGNALGYATMSIPPTCTPVTMDNLTADQQIVPLCMRRPYSDELTYGPFSFGRRSERDLATLISGVELKEFSLQFISKNSMNEMN